MMQTSPSADLAAAAPGLVRQGSVARTNAVAMLKRAASQREIKSRAETPALPGAFPAESDAPLSNSNSVGPAESSSHILPLDPDHPALPLTPADPHFDQTAAEQAAHPLHTNASSYPHTAPSSYSQAYPIDNAIASTSMAPARSPMLLAPSPNDSGDRSRSPMFQDRSNQRAFNRSPLPSLEQLRARILLERESEGLQRSASTSAASQAARAYALEKLLGNSGTDVFYDHTPDGIPIGRGAATPSPTPLSGSNNDYADMASDDESAHVTRLKRQSIKHRPGLRRSRTINGLTAMAEAQNKADFVQGVFLAVPGPASNRISRIHQRRVERQSMLKPASVTPSEADVPEEKSIAPIPPQAAVAEAAPGLTRQQSQRQIARTEMMRKLSTRGRGNATPTQQPPTDEDQVADAADSSGVPIRQPRLPQVITDSPAVDETISPVGVVIRPPSSPVPPHLSLLDASTSASPAPVFRQALSPASAANAVIHAHGTVQAEHDSLAASASGLKASSSDASIGSYYAHSTTTNASARHFQERNRESAMALLNNEDSFGLEVSPSIPSISMDAAAGRSGTTSKYQSAAPQRSGLQDGDESENDGLTVDFGRDAQQKRRAGVVGLGLDSVSSQAAPTVETSSLGARKENRGGLSPSNRDNAGASTRASRIQSSSNRLRSPRPTTQELLSSPASYTDEEALEDDAFYKLYSPAPDGFDDDEESEDDANDQKIYTRGSNSNGKADETVSSPHLLQNGKDAANVQGLGLISSGGTPKHSQQPESAELPTTPPHRLLYRSAAAVPCDPSPSTDTDFGEARRTPWVTSSPSGFSVPLRLSNSLMSTAQAIAIDSPAIGPSPEMRCMAASRTVHGDWPMSIVSGGTHPSSRESLEGRGEAEARLRSSEEARALNGVPANGSPLVEVLEDEAVNDAEHSKPQQLGSTAGKGTSEAQFELLPVGTTRAKPSDRVKAMLGPNFVAEYADDLDLESRSRSSIGGDDDGTLKVPNPRGNGSSLSNNSNVSINEISDVDGEVDDAYLRKVDRMADKLGKLARTNKTAGVNGAPKLERSNTANGSRFTEHVSGVPNGHSQQPSTDLSVLAGNEKLQPFPGLAKTSPVHRQDEFSRMTVSAAPPSSTLPAQMQPRDVHAAASDSPPSVTATKDEQDPAGKQVGLFSSLRRKASSLRRTPSSAKEAGGFWARRGKREDSPKLPAEASFISAPILTDATPGPAPTPSQPIVRVEQPHNDPTFEHRLFDGQSTDEVATGPAPAAAVAADLQRNASISSVVSARIRPDLQDGTADADALSSSTRHVAVVDSLAPSTAAMMHRYSRMLSTAGPTQTVPGATLEDMQDPPRKLLATDPVFQVISSTTIKDRYLFLFSDILVIAKPVAAPGAEAGQTMGQMKQASVLPTLSWKFSVKNILELHRLKVSVTTNTRTASAKTRAQNPVLWGFVSHFGKDPDAAVRALVAKTGLDPSAASIAQLLYQTPELDRHDLTQYLGHASRRDILKAYVSQHRHVGVSIESALRTLLLDLRFPTDLDAFEALLMHFAQSWTQHNASMIKPTFTAQIASDLVFAIMALNDALHTGSQAGPSSVTSPNFPRPVTVVTPGLFSAPCRELSKADFVSVFRQHDPEQVLSDRTLSRIYLSIRSEPLVQALDRYEPRFTIRIKGGKLPTRLTYAQPAEPVTLVIPAPDPDLAIRLYAQDTTFEPPILTFGTSNEASFTMWTKSLGAKQIVFVRAGRNARFYGGTEIDVTDAPAGASEDSPLPRSFNVTVERAFMKHSFTLTYMASSEAKRFMFSFEDRDTVEAWTRRIKVQAEECLKQKAKVVAGMGREMQAASLQVLRETLVGKAGGLARSATVSEGRAGQGSLGVGLGAPSVLDRTTSTSRHYYASSGVGRHERELLIPQSAQSGHTKGASSLSLQPPSAALTRLQTGIVARSNSARSASSPHSPLSSHPAGTRKPAAELADDVGAADRAMQGSSIVSVVRLNSLLVNVVADYQRQQREAEAQHV